MLGTTCTGVQREFSGQVSLLRTLASGLPIETLSQASNTDKPDDDRAPVGLRTTRIGSLPVWTILRETLPKMKRASGPSPRAPTTIRSTLCSSAAVKIPLLVSPMPEMVFEAAS